MKVHSVARNRLQSSLQAKAPPDRTGRLLHIPPDDLRAARFTARRKAAYEALHPETAHGGDRKSSRQVGDMNEAERFTADTASKTGQSERAVQRNAERGEKVTTAALAVSLFAAPRPARPRP